MTAINHPVVRALYEAHVSHAKALLTGNDLFEHLAHSVDADLANAANLTINQVVTRDLIKATAKTYAVDMPMSGGIPELVGDIARAIHAHPIQDETRLSDIVSDQQMGEMVGKVAEMRELRERLVHTVLGNPLLADMAGDLIFRGIKGYLAQGNAAAKNIPGASALMGLGKSVLSKASPSLEKTLDDGLLAYVRKSTTSTLLSSEKALLAKMDESTLKRVAMDLWADIKHRPASSLRQFMSAESLDEAFVVGYEFWRADLRHTKYYSTLIDIGIDSFFDKYGDSTLQHVLDEVGVTRDMILQELHRFAPPVIAALDETGMLEGMIRRQLLPFYRSGVVEAVLAEHLPS